MARPALGRRPGTGVAGSEVATTAGCGFGETFPTCWPSGANGDGAKGPRVYDWAWVEPAPEGAGQGVLLPIVGHLLRSGRGAQPPIWTVQLVPIGDPFSEALDTPAPLTVPEVRRLLYRLSTYGRISAAVVPVETAAPGNGPAAITDAAFETSFCLDAWVTRPPPIKRSQDIQLRSSPATVNLSHARRGTPIRRVTSSQLKHRSPQPWES